MPGFTRPANRPQPDRLRLPHARDRTPIVFDIACSVAARGHILLAAREGRPIPAGMGARRSGAPTTDTQRALRGMLLPVGGHKGIGIAMMVECLAGALAATADSIATANATRFPTGGAAGRQGAFFGWCGPARSSMPGCIGDYMSEWTTTYLEAGGDDARLPGASGRRGSKARGANAASSCPHAVEQELRGVGARLRVPFPS